MKKLIILFTFFCVALGVAHGLNLRIELKGSYLYPSEKAFKDIYGGGFLIGGEISVEVLKNLSIWAGGNYFTKKGKLTFTQEDTEIKLIPIGCGVQYEFQKGRFTPYLGLGVNYYQYKESNPIGDVNANELGYIGKVGAYINFSNHFNIDFFLNYSYCEIKPLDIKINIGGLEAGFGFGYEF